MTTYERIRRIFLQPEQAYLLSDAARLLGYSDQEIIAAIEGGDMSLDSAGGLPSVPWEEVALAAAERWPQEVIEEALGDEASALPELIRLTDLHVRVPRFSVFVLGRIAQRVHNHQRCCCEATAGPRGSGCRGVRTFDSRNRRRHSLAAVLALTPQEDTPMSSVPIPLDAQADGRSRTIKSPRSIV